jgi:hypothetical protein
VSELCAFCGEGAPVACSMCVVKFEKRLEGVLEKIRELNCEDCGAYDLAERALGSLMVTERSKP